MANQVAARLKGDDYQHLYSWLLALELKMSKKHVFRVRVEDSQAGSADDVTVKYAAEAREPDQFCQIKFHVDHREHYSTEVLIREKDRGTSLLRKLWETWQLLRADATNRGIRINLISNWSWDSHDKVGGCIDGDDGKLSARFFDAGPTSDVGKLRDQWKAHLGADAESFRAFAECLRFKLGNACFNDLKDRLAERMQFLGLKSDETALLVVVGIVREWIKSRKADITLDVLDASIDAHDLLVPPNIPKSTTIYLVTVKEQRFDIEPDYLLDWRDHFVGGARKCGHQLRAPEDWNNRLLPELEGIERRISQATDSRVIRARGLARLSAWFAFGYTFSEVARYTIEVDQQGELWSTDAIPSRDFNLRINNGSGSIGGERLRDDGKVVAVGISVTGSLDSDVREHLEQQDEAVVAVLLIAPERELGNACLRSAGDVVALANGVKELTRGFVKRWAARRLLLYYFGPLSGACFIGHRLNAVCREVQIMEDQQPGYAPSFLLR